MKIEKINEERGFLKALLSKKDLLSLIKGTEPTYEAMEDKVVKELGKYSGGFSDSWNWKSCVDCDEIPISELVRVYQICSVRYDEFKEKGLQRLVK